MGLIVNAKDTVQCTALHQAAKCGHLPVIECLLEHGADINARNKLKRTALHLTAEAGHVEIIEYLLKHGAELCPDEHGKTPLYYFLAYYRACTMTPAVLETIKVLIRGDFVFQSLQIK